MPLGTKWVGRCFLSTDGKPNFFQHWCESVCFPDADCWLVSELKHHNHVSCIVRTDEMEAPSLLLNNIWHIVTSEVFCSSGSICETYFQETFLIFRSSGRKVCTDPYGDAVRGVQLFHGLLAVPHIHLFHSHNHVVRSANAPSVVFTWHSVLFKTILYVHDTITALTVTLDWCHSTQVEISVRTRSRSRSLCSNVNVGTLRPWASYESNEADLLLL